MVSAEQARTLLSEAGAKPAAIARIEAAVLSTAEHSPDLREDERLLSDIDLAILGAPSARYQEYERQIRLEYGFVDPGRYRAGRSTFLRGMLERERIFQTGPLAVRFEQAARHNIETAIATLTHSPT